MKLLKILNFEKMQKMLPIIFISIFIGLLSMLAAYTIFSVPGEFVNDPLNDDPETSVYQRTVTFGTNEIPAAILEAYRDPQNTEIVEVLFEEICGDRTVANLILQYSSEYNVPPSLAFSLCYEESRFKPRAINRGNLNQTVDRGLFQLNSASFPNFTEEDFFDPEINIKNGLSHLRWCLDHAGTEVAGIAMYNAGTGRVGSGRTPKATLDYVSRIINRQQKIYEFFLSEYPKLAAEVELPVKPKSLALKLLTPLGKR